MIYSGGNIEDATFGFSYNRLQPERIEVQLSGDCDESSVRTAVDEINAILANSGDAAFRLSAVTKVEKAIVYVDKDGRAITGSIPRAFETLRKAED